MIAHGAEKIVNSTEEWVLLQAFGETALTMF